MFIDMNLRRAGDAIAIATVRHKDNRKKYEGRGTSNKK